MATWNAVYESNPSNAGTATSGYASIKDPKTEVRIRMQNEHDTYSRASSGADGSRLQDWVHIQGAARTYYQSTTPTNRPDGSTALSSDDDGRLQMDSRGVFQTYSGTGFCNVPVIEKNTSKTLKYYVISLGAFTLPNNIMNGGWFDVCIGAGDPGYHVSIPTALATSGILEVQCIFNDDNNSALFMFPFPTEQYEYSGEHITNNLWLKSSNSGKWYVRLQTHLADFIYSNWSFSNSSVNRGYVTVWYYE